MRSPAAIPASRGVLSQALIDRVRGDPGTIAESTGWGGQSPLIERGGLHEWFAESPPVALLAALIRRVRDRGSRVVWIGRDAWAHPGWDGAGIDRSVFVDPANDAERLWAIDLALRCDGVAGVVADGAGLDMAATRRLQLAAKAGGTLGLLVRPPPDLDTLSAARTRWRVTPAPNPDARFFPQPRWTVELLRCKGLRPATDARRWTAQLNHDTGDVNLVPDAAGRCLATPGQTRSA